MLYCEFKLNNLPKHDHDVASIVKKNRTNQSLTNTKMKEQTTSGNMQYPSTQTLMKNELWVNVT
jgi:hypothetical protein